MRPISLPMFGAGLQFSLPNGELWRTSMINLPVFPVRTPPRRSTRECSRSSPIPRPASLIPRKWSVSNDAHPKPFAPCPSSPADLQRPVRQQRVPRLERLPVHECQWHGFGYSLDFEPSASPMKRSVQRTSFNLHTTSSTKSPSRFAVDRSNASGLDHWPGRRPHGRRHHRLAGGGGSKSTLVSSC